MNILVKTGDIASLKKVGLVYVSDGEPGIARERRGKSFCYRLPDGNLLSDPEEKARIRALGLPPAYTNVWICIAANGHIQATGRDAKGRKQYRYHNDWQALRDEKKYDDLLTFGSALPRIRNRVARDMTMWTDPERATLAALVLLLDTTHLRVGNKAYRETNGTYGATTLLKRHVSFGTELELRFAAKGGRKVRRRLRSPRLQKILERIAGLPGKQLFVWQDAQGVLHSIDAGQLNRYLSEIGVPGLSAKTFRTWGGTLAAFDHAVTSARRDEMPTIKGMAQAASDKLFNTPAVCRKSYIHPAVLALATDKTAHARLLDILASRNTAQRGLLASESRLLTFLTPS